MHNAKRIIGLLLLLLAALLVLAFSVRNNGAVTVDYFIGSTELPLAVALALALVLGAVVGVVASVARVLRAKREARVLRREVALRRKEIDNLRSAPLKDQG